MGTNNPNIRPTGAPGAIGAEPTSSSALVRKLGPRRRKEDEREREFTDALEERSGEPAPRDSEAVARNVDRSVSPPTEEDGGTRIDLLC